MASNNIPHVCSVDQARGLDNSMRKWTQNPSKILAPYVKPNMIAMDMGCGPGFFTIPMAHLLNGKGKVVAVDLQQGMLDKLSKKLKGSKIASNIELFKCGADSIAYKGQVDFILAFYMLHEVPNQEVILSEFKSILKPDGKILVVEPWFHVNKKAFSSMLNKAHKLGFASENAASIFFSRSVILTKP